jgi:hypothetical protein
MVRALALTLLVIPGCTERDPTYCDEKIACPAGQVCDLSTKTCRPAHEAGAPDQRVDGPPVDLVDLPVSEAPPAVTWAVEYSSPDKVDILDIWGSSATDVWAVGDLGRVLRYDGTKWSKVSVTTDEALFAVWGASAQNVWIGGGSGAMLHYDGATLNNETPKTVGIIQEIWGSSKDDVWAAVSEDHLLHHDGKAWVPVAAPLESFTVWGSGPADVFAGSFHGNILHYAGTDWTPFQPPPGETNEVVTGIWGSSDVDVWAVTDFGKVLRFDGTGWKEVKTVNSMPLEAIWGLSPTDVWIGGLAGLTRFDGVTWTADAALAALTNKEVVAIWGTSPDNIWVAVREGTILHYR